MIRHSTHPQNTRRYRTFLLLSASVIAITLSQLASATPLIVADSAVTDRAARRIRTNVVKEGLKPITTKEETAQEAGSDVLYVQGVQGGEGESLIVETNEAAPIRPVVETQPAPGVRQPATESVERTKKTKKPAPEKTSNADQVQTMLEAGNRRFVNQTFRKDGKLQADRLRTAVAESPRALVLSCSDSRVPPEVIFDQGVGEITVIRTLGSSLDSAVIASLEHAVQQSDTSLIVVLGHTRCSAIEAAFKHDPNQSAGSPALDQAIAEIRPRLPNSRNPAHDKSMHSKGFEIEASTNAQAIAGELTKRSEILGERVKAGALRITPALYNVETGLVNFY